MHRRDLLKLGGAGAALGYFRLGSHAWAAINPNGAKRRLVVIFLRGAVDGLNVVVPYTEAAYYKLRPTIAVPRPGQTNGSLDLDGKFGLHPALASLMPLWKERSLAFVHASGSPDESRSHFEAQAYMESGTPGVKTTTDGWMNRLLAALPGPHAATEAVNFGPTMPRILRGRMPVSSIGENKGGRQSRIALDRPAVHTTFDEMYSGDSALSVAYHEGQSAHAQFMSELQRDMTEAAGDAPTPKGFAEDVAKFCRLAQHDPTVQVGFFALSGWDTHVREGSAAEGVLPVHLRQLGDGLAGFRSGLGSAYADTAILVISEFGRTARENGDGGTDHGHGNVMWALGGAIKGGKVYGKWPGLDDHELHEARDLAVMTDFRSVAGSVLSEHLRLTPADLGAVFPDAESALASRIDIVHA
jgi:uncharacterized protein (DUF1501 family)